MKKTIYFVAFLGFLLLSVSSCKTKQNIAKIPGAKIPAPANTVAPTPNTTESGVSQTVPAEPEVTRNENFKLADGESNTDALNYKYHVVVGSFGKQSNAKGLQSTLNSEGNHAVIVVNERGMFRVLINSYNDYNQAHARIRELSSRFPDAWVLVQK